MPRAENPFTPGFGQVPPMLAGRDGLLRDLVDLVQTAALDKRTPRPAMIVGVRGVGKTTLLKELAAYAGKQYGWPAAHVEIGRDGGFVDELIDALNEVRVQLSHRGSQRGLRATSATLRAQVGPVGGEVQFERAAAVERTPAVRLRLTLAETVAAALELDGGFVVTIDEAQLADKSEMNALGKAFQHGTLEGWPFVAAAAGLPSIREDDKSTTYFERGLWHELGSIGAADALLALAEPAKAGGRPMNDEAAALLAEASGGYPYAIQLYGHHAWRESTCELVITVDAAKRAVLAGQDELRHGLYARRWTVASDGQRQYMTAVAELLAEGVSPTGGSVAASLGRKTPQLSRVREELITRGFLTSERGVLRFTIPGMAEYVRDQHEGERALANPEIARYVPGSRPPGDAREAEQLNRAAQPKP